MKTDVESYLISLETSLLDGNMRRSNRLNELLADDFVEFGSSGETYSKEHLIALLNIEPPRDIKAYEFTVREFIPGNALIGYRASEGDTHTLRSSLWQLRGGRWQLVFHQGTVVAS
jgi:hypothetical protein